MATTMSPKQFRKMVPSYHSGFLGMAYADIRKGEYCRLIVVEVQGLDYPDCLSQDDEVSTIKAWQHDTAFFNPFNDKGEKIEIFRPDAEVEVITNPLYKHIVDISGVGRDSLSLSFCALKSVYRGLCERPDTKGNKTRIQQLLPLLYCYTNIHSEWMREMAFLMEIRKLRG